VRLKHCPASQAAEEEEEEEEEEEDRVNEIDLCIIAPITVRFLGKLQLYFCVEHVKCKYVLNFM